MSSDSQDDEEIHISTKSLRLMTSLVKEISANLKSYQRMFRTFMEANEESACELGDGQLIVNQSDFAKLSTEVAQLNQNLPKVLSEKLITSLSQIENISKAEAMEFPKIGIVLKLDPSDDKLAKNINSFILNWALLYKGGSNFCKSSYRLDFVYFERFPLPVPSWGTEMETLKKTLDDTTLERNHWKVRCDAASQDCQNEKEHNRQLSRQVQELTDQMGQQSDYCSSLGSACCTILWRVSRCEESIQAILFGSKVDEFLLLVQSTLDSFLMAYKEDWPQEKTNEELFILALCGIITNIAASAFGRDFLVNNSCGCKVIDTFFDILNDAPSKKSTKLKNLILMSLYNLSINQKGLKYISSKPNFFQLLVWLLKEEPSNECCINILRLMQSVISEANISVLHQIKELLPEKDLHFLSNSRNKDIRDLATELSIDLNY